MSPNGRGASWAMLLVGVWFAVADATCPQNPCDCLGAALNFDVVAADTLAMQAGSYGSRGYYRYTFPGFVAGDVCAGKARMAGSPYADAETQVGDLVLLAPAGKVAVRFRNLRDGYAGAAVLGDLVTAGGRIVGENDTVSGEIDTTGTDERVSSCQQAVLDMVDASTTLAGLPPTMDLGRLVLRGPDDNLTISVGAGVHVINATAISVMPGLSDGYRTGATFGIEWANDTEAVIINTPSLRVGDLSTVYGATVVNVYGKGSMVTVGREAFASPILAPHRRVALRPMGESNAEGIFADRVRIRGSQVAGGFSACFP